MAQLDIPSQAKVYLRPIQFVDSPVGHDGAVARLAGGMQWFAAYELTAVLHDYRLGRQVIPVAEFEQVAATLPQRERLLRLAANLSAPRAPLTLGERTLRFDQPAVMGILNLTPDSFSDGGVHANDPEGAAAAAFDMATAGAAILDIGGESTRPDAATVWEGDEIARVVPVIERLAHSGAAISIDTRKAAVMEAALAAGAHMVNDVAALLWDDRALEVVVRAGCPVVLMHSYDPAKGPHEGKHDLTPLAGVYDWLETRVETVVAAGVDRAKIIVDPGIGFGKGMTTNLELLNGLALFQGLGCPVLLGASRKRMIGALSNEAPADRRLGGSVALALKAAELGAQWLRVHDVYETAQALRVWRGLRDAALVAP